MCGIAGYFQSKPQTLETATGIGESMARRIITRGPDDSGVWVDADAGITLSHRRLSIIDLSAAGHQPMMSASGRFVISFNGEIYNHLELREQLDTASPNWHGHSDTETLLAGFDVWGIETTIKKSVGMFGIAVWDRLDRVLSLIRDRVGEKPVYYGWQGDAFLFASELKAFRAHPAFRREIDRDSLTLFLRHNYIPAPYSIYRNIHKLQPGTILTLPLRDRTTHRVTPNPVPYWCLADVAADGLRDPFDGTETEAMAALEDRLKSAIGLQMCADVPLGAFLSGGIDSSTVVALMQAQSTRPVKTFTIGFYESQYDEADKARAIAQRLGTEHTELYVTPEVAKDVIPMLPDMYDEPFADSSQIPTFLVSQLARQHVKVSLSGDAGDELFGGYPRYFLAQALWRKLAMVPAFGRRLSANIVRMTPAAVWNTIGPVVRPVIPGFRHGRLLSGLAFNAAGLMSASDREELYYRLVSYWKRPSDVVIGASEPATIFGTRSRWPTTAGFADSMMYLDGMTYLPDDILTKVDRAAMAVSLETRVPLLDHRVIELAWKLPLSYKIRDGQGKWILRQILYKYVPKELVTGPKMGFGVPIDSWLCGPLSDWAESLLNEDRLKREGFFRPDPIRQKLHQHLSRQSDWQYYIWGFLMFQSWMERQSL
jgi:asparagine synthase (glutamine-hydrolysing)